MCGRRIRSNALIGSTNRIAKLHLEPCPAWGPEARIAARTWEARIPARVAAINLDDSVLPAVVGRLSTSGRPVGLDRARLERAKRELAIEHAAGHLSDDAYLGRMAEFRAQADELGRVEHRELTAARAVEWLRAFAEDWTQADVPEARKELLQAIYERIVVEGPCFVAVKLTTAAYNHGLAIALPEKGCHGAPKGMARPEGVGHAITTYSVPIEGRDGPYPAARQWRPPRRNSAPEPPTWAAGSRLIDSRPFVLPQRGARVDGSYLTPPPGSASPSSRA